MKTTGIKTTDTGLVVDGVPEMDEFIQEAKLLAATDRVTPIQIGDLLNSCEQIYGKEFAQLTNYWPERKYGTLANYKSVTKSVPYSVRPKGVRFSQLEAVRKLSHEEQRNILEKAVAENIGGEDIRNLLQGENKKKVDEDEIGTLLIKAIELFSRLTELTEGKQMNKAIKMAYSIVHDLINNPKKDDSTQNQA
jgi:hypothetical protein